MRQICNQLGLCKCQTLQGAETVQKREGVMNPSSEQLREAKKMAAEEHPNDIANILSLNNICRKY